ncbi:cytochrome c biogenesis protein DipZ [Sphingomonas sp. NPDC019816]|jgi:cytochrome c biogenesis protein CcdA/thiol-disulfide isomerase/thioredoxin|uniref:Cytochrome c biogenesis protein DipZ n=1 Tax=Sphingobium naphthae TaxID=1886786 RepID=A0ABU4A1P5_9SPHN|nr:MULTISPECIES: cytochrome c biogenesis protein DipZ [Sphingobium]MBS0503128.1 cytochrome c biogenesis protein DipZ [Pseudomonadota bacterium]MDV5825683.1 cytochrome c biogenesis protein DipZ [Sphingobium naphthae]
MLLLILSYLAGVLTIISPCILPVLPFVFARAGQPFIRSGLPLLLGMAVTFAGVATLAAVGGSWAVQANSLGRAVALLILGLFGLLLVFPALADRATRPIVGLGARITEAAGPERTGASFWPSLLLGVATGLLWAPCAGPILGLVLTGAALQGATIGTSLLLLAYAAGAATSLAFALLIGGRVFAAMKRSIRVGEWFRRSLGALVLLAVAAIALGLDTGLLTKLSLAGTSTVEQRLLDSLRPDDRSEQTSTLGDGPLGFEGELASLSGATAWLNSPPLSREALRGKVVLVDFWTYSCINCLRTLPYVRAWEAKYRAAGLVVIGVHAPEFAFERDPENVAKAVRDLGVTYPVALDNNHAIWRGFNNSYWPAHYFIDARGRIRYHHFGEGNYAESEKVIQRLLAENGRAVGDMRTVTVRTKGASAAASWNDVRSAETYLGHLRAERFASPGGFVRDTGHEYVAPPRLPLNAWALAGRWLVGSEYATAQSTGARIVYRFHARDLHLVLGPSATGRRVRFRVTIDGKPPAGDHGTDINDAGNGMIEGQRLYQLVRQKSAVRERTFAIEFLDPGAQAFAFTFG